MYNQNLFNQNYINKVQYIELFMKSKDRIIIQKD